MSSARIAWLRAIRVDVRATHDPVTPGDDADRDGEEGKHEQKERDVGHVPLLAVLAACS